MRLSALLLLGLPCLLHAAALLPLPSPKQLPPISEIQPNRGQAAAGILFQTRGAISVAAQGAALLFSPIGARQNFVGGNSNPQVSFSDPLPGIAHDYSTGDPQRWITNIPRYATARVTAMYPGLELEYHLDDAGKLTLSLLVAPNADLNQVVFEIPDAILLSVNENGAHAQFIQPNPGLSTFLNYVPAVSSTPLNFERVSAKAFRITAPSRDLSSVLRIDLAVSFAPAPFLSSIDKFSSDAQSNLWAAVMIPDAAGRPDPFASVDGNGCGLSIGTTIPCNDVAVYKFSRAGDLLSVTYLSGSTNESPAFLGIASDGSVIVTGNTDSSDFPVSTNTYQSAYAGPPSQGLRSLGEEASGDYFALRLDSATGTLLASTYFGGSNLDKIGETVIAPDGSLYFLHKWLNADQMGLPTSSGALMPQCVDKLTGDSHCVNAYVAHLSRDLDRIIMGTYVPGTTQATMRLHSDGSVYYAGTDSPSFQPTPGAYQTAINGPHDAIVARLDPTGSRLLFGTYLGGPSNDWILRSAVSSDGSVWVHLSSFEQCCVDIRYRLIRLDAKGENILADLPIDVGDLATGQDGGVLAITASPLTPSTGAFLSSPCPSYGLGYARLSAIGEPLFFTYLPRTSYYDFDGTGPHGLPIVTVDNSTGTRSRFEIIEGQDMGAFAGCMVDAANFSMGDVVSPGEIVTIFGSQMGPLEGVAFSLVNEQLPTSLGGTQLLVNGQPVPLLYVSASQINAILPFDLQPRTSLDAVLKVGTASSNKLPWSRVDFAGITLFTLDGSGTGQAAAINEDGTVNSPQHPAKPGARVMLFGTGGGQTNPPGIAGEVTPLELRWLSNPAGVRVGNSTLSVEFAGAAPGLVSGVNQINIQLPNPMPKIEGYPSGTLPVAPFSQGALPSPSRVTISVTGN